MQSTSLQASKKHVSKKTKSFFAILAISFSIFAVFYVQSLSVAEDATTLKAAQEKSDWSIITAPGEWEDQLDGKFEEYDGYAWYRCYVKVPDNWAAFVEGEKNLFSQSVTISTKNVGDVHEIYVNGQKIGGGGNMPPKYKANHNYHRTKIPPKLLKKGFYNTIAIRIYNKKGPGGFLNVAPNVAGYFKECVFNKEWEFRTGDDVKWALPAQETKPEHATYSNFRQATESLGRPEKLITGRKLTPAKSLSLMKVDKDLAVDQVLAEPIVAQPTEIFFDERGRMWVVQYRQYPYPAGMKIISRDRYYRAVYDKMSPPPPNHFKGMDRISIHEDTNGDGVFDKHKNFLDDLNIAISAAKGRGGIYVLNSPYLLFFPDANNDDVPDGPPKVLLEGFGIDDAHAVMNGLRWGPDGWLYWCQGSTISARVKVPGTSDKTLIYCEGKGTWRYHPEKKIVELFNEGGYNEMGYDFDMQGHLLGGLNASNHRVVHEVQGGFYVKGGTNKFGPTSNPYTFGSINAVKHASKVQRFDHSVVKYEAKELPKRFHGSIVSVDPLHRNIWLSKIEQDGSTFKTEDIGEPMQGKEDVGFRPVMIKTGPDGCVYVADFYEEFIAHGQHYQGQIDPSTGRVYRIRSQKKYNHKPFDYTKSTTDQLVDTLLTHDNKWHRQIALRMIADRKEKSIAPRLHKVLANEKGQQALEALWALNLIGEFNHKLAMQTLKHENPMVRMWTIRLLGDDKKVCQDIADQLAEMAKTDTNAEVRRVLSICAARIPGKHALPIIAGLMTHDEDVNDQMIPMLLWWALESKAAGNREEIVKLFEDKSLWSKKLVQGTLLERISRRYAAAAGRQDLLTCAKLLKISPDKQSRKILLTGFEAAYKGRALSGIPKELAKQLTADGGGSVALRMRLGDEAALQTALKAVEAPKTKLKSRIELIQILGELKEKRAMTIFSALLITSKEDDVKIKTLAALQNFDDDAIGKIVTEDFNNFPLAVREVAQTLLASRKSWSKQLLAAVEAGKIDPKKISADTALKMTLHQDDALTKLVGKHWAATQKASNAELQAKIAKFNAIIKKGQGNPYPGKKLFVETCAKCHRLFSDGRNVGPDLTQYKRDDSLRMLLHIVNPSAEIREGYENHLLITTQGRVSTGFLFDQDKEIVVIRGADGQNITVPRDDILKLERQAKSIMPEGLLDKMTDQQIRDLFAYLSKSQPISGKQ